MVPKLTRLCHCHSYPTLWDSLGLGLRNRIIRWRYVGIYQQSHIGPKILPVFFQWKARAWGSSRSPSSSQSPASVGRFHRSKDRIEIQDFTLSPFKIDPLHNSLAIGSAQLTQGSAQHEELSNDILRTWLIILGT